MVEQRKPDSDYYNSWKFTGKELDEETGLYYYGARFYQPSWSFWMSVDPLVDRRPSLTPYNYVQYNPLNRIDPNGLTDYKIYKGKTTRVGTENDDPDRIVKIDKDGNVKRKGEGFLGFLVRKSERGKAKIAVDGIAQGFLEDGQNLKENVGQFDINGEGQPTLKEFNDFISKYSDYVRKEIAGIRLGEDENNDDVTKVITNKYKESTRYRSRVPAGWMSRYGDNLKAHFHTHPNNDHTPSQDFDIPLKNKYPNLSFFIIAGGYEKEF